MSELANPATGYEVVAREAPATMERNLRIGARLWASAFVFFFFAFLFAYFYLRTLNSDHLWHPKGVDPSVTLGALITAAVVVAAVLLRLAVGHHHADDLRAWRQKGALALALVLLALVLQVVEWATQGFGPTDGGFASVFIGWTGLQAIFLLGFVYWLETTLATSLRYRKVFSAEFGPGEAAGDAHREAPDIHDPLSLVRHQLEAVSFFAYFLGGEVLVSFVVLYLL